MAKKITFLVVFLIMLVLASVTAFATGSNSATPENGLTEDKTLEIDYTKYESLFLGSDAASDNTIVSVKWNRTESSSNPLSYTLTGNVVSKVEKPVDNPVILLMFIKSDGNYVPLYSTDNKDKKTNKIEAPYIIVSNVDLLNLGSDKVNDIRIVAFRKNDADKLEENKNFQIIDTSIVAAKNTTKGLKFEVETIMNALFQVK